MPVVRKPKSVEEFIESGGSVSQVPVPTPPPAKAPASAKEEEKGLKLRLPVSLLEQVDAAVASRRPAPSRHQWILEAIYEKLDREQDNDQSDI
ncbi:hypothetical protein ACN4EK_24430 [Pantanalinema rosaneae CENA516]|uniref:hypothetical protein n=1 Tax=Pantanalinema rosaneae TaxID=1620701 RepID=UPI003D6E628A